MHRPPRPGADRETKVVARIVGLEGCRWLDPHAAAEVGDPVTAGRKFALTAGKLTIVYNVGDRLPPEGPGAYEVDADHSSRLSPVTASRKFALAGGKSIVVYGVGARVTLEGPAIYEVDSDHSGRLSLGKLRFRSVELDFSGSDKDRRMPGFRPPSIMVKPQFYVRGPSVIVMDEAAEYTLSIEPSGASRVHISQGTVVLQYPHGVLPADSVEGRWWGFTEGDKTHFLRAYCHAGEPPLSHALTANPLGAADGRSWRAAGRRRAIARRARMA